jgi:hypothetical protein
MSQLAATLPSPLTVISSKRMVSADPSGELTAVAAHSAPSAPPGAPITKSSAPNIPKLAILNWLSST